MSIAVAMLSGIVMIPLYLKFIPLDVYGVWLASGNILVWLGAIDPGLTTVLQQRIGFAYGKHDFQSIRETAGCGLIISAVISIFIITSGIVVARYLPSLLKPPSSVDASLIVKAFCLAVIGNSLNLFSFSITAISRGLQSSLGYGIINLVVAVLALILQIILLYQGFGLLAIAIGSVFCGVFYTLGQGMLLLWRLIDEKIGFRFSFANFPSLIKLLSFTFLGRAAGVVANNVDLFIVARMLGPQTVAILALTRKVPVLSRELVNQPCVAFQPAVSHLTGSGEMDKARDVLTRLMRILLWTILGILGGIIALNGDFIKLWVGSHLFAGETINLILCVGVFVNLATYCLGNTLIALGNIKGTSIAGFVQSMLFVLLVIYGTKYFGVLGTVIAPLISVCAVSVWYYPKSFSKLLKLPSQKWKNIIYEGFLALAVMLALVLGFFWLHPQNWFQFFVLVALFCALYASFIYMFSTEFRAEMKNAKEHLNKIILKGSV